MRWTVTTKFEMSKSNMVAASPVAKSFTQRLSFGIGGAVGSAARATVNLFSPSATRAQPVPQVSVTESDLSVTTDEYLPPFDVAVSLGRDLQDAVDDPDLHLGTLTVSNLPSNPSKSLTTVIKFIGDELEDILDSKYDFSDGPDTNPVYLAKAYGAIVKSIMTDFRNPEAQDFALHLPNGDTVSSLRECLECMVELLGGDPETHTRRVVTVCLPKSFSKKLIDFDVTWQELKSQNSGIQGVIPPRSEPTAPNDVDASIRAPSPEQVREVASEVVTEAATLRPRPQPRSISAPQPSRRTCWVWQ